MEWLTIRDLYLFLTAAFLVGAACIFITSAIIASISFFNGEVFRHESHLVDVWVFLNIGLVFISLFLFIVVSFFGYIKYIIKLILK